MTERKFMTRRRHWLAALPLLLLFAIVLIVKALGGLGDSSADSPVPSSRTGPSGTSEARPNPPVVAEPTPLTPDPDSNGAARMPALEARVERTETFDLAGAHWAAGRVVFPPGAPPEPTLEVVALSLDSFLGDPEADVRIAELGALHQAERFGVEEFFNPPAPESDDPLQAAEWARRPVAADGTFEVPVRAGARTARLFLRAHYLILGDAQRARIDISESGATPDPVELHPILGGRIVLRLQAPAQASAEDIATLAGTGVHASGWSMSLGQPLGRRGRVDEDHVLALNALWAELRYTVVANNDAFAPWVNPQTIVEPGRTTELVAELTLGGRVSGRVLDPGGRPLAGTDVRASILGRHNFMSGGGAISRASETGVDGSFVLRGIPVGGDVTLNARHPRFRPRSHAVGELQDGEQRTGLEIRLASGSSVGGRVLLPDGSPAGDVQVELTPQAGQGSRSELRTTAAGRFLFEALEDGPFAVLATHRTASGVWKVSQSAVPTGAELELVLEETLAVPGRLVDDLGEPVANFTVKATREDFPIRDTERSEIASEGEDAVNAGRFVVDGVTAGSWTFRGFAEGYIADAGITLEFPGSAEVLLRVTRAGSIAGRVVDPAGNPVLGARVQPRRIDGGAQGGAETDVEGRFVLDGLSAGAYEVRASSEQWAPSPPVELEVAAGADALASPELLLTMTAGGALTGEVYDADGSPAIRRSVILQRAGNRGGMGRDMDVVTDEAGLFEARHLEPGTYLVLCTPDVSALSGDEGPADLMTKMRTATAEVTEGETTHVIVGAPPVEPVRVTGRVTRHDEPISGSLVMFVGEDQAMLDGLSMNRTDDDGRFETVLDKPGNYTLLVEGGLGSEDTVEFNERIPRGETHHLELRLPTGGIMGIVLDPRGRPAPGVRVSWSRAGGLTNLSALTSSRSRSTEEQGGFAYTTLMSGVYELRAEPSGKSSWGRAILEGVVVEEGKHTQGVELRLTQAGTLTGRVVDEGGSPVARATLFVRDSRGRALQQVSSTETRLDGTFRVTNVPLGAVTVSARDYLSGRASEEVAAEVLADDETEVSVVLAEGGTLIVNVEDESGNPVASSVTVTDSEGRRVDGLLPSNFEDALMMKGVSSTMQRIGPLTPGRYRVEARTFDGKEASRPVTVRAGGEKRVRLKLD